MSIIDTFSLKNKTALVTGGAGLYGRQIVQALAEAGARTYIASRNLEALEKLAAENENIHLHICYSKPGEKDVKGKDYHHEGRVGIELLPGLDVLVPFHSWKIYQKPGDQERSNL